VKQDPAPMLVVLIAHIKIRPVNMKVPLKENIYG
jgi:hypothetical protein